MYDIERSEGKIRVIDPLTGQVLIELNNTSVVVIGNGENRFAIAASDASDVDLVSALIGMRRV